MVAPEGMMIRDRIKRAVRKAALKAFGMEKDAEDRAPTPEQPRFSGAEQDFSKIPRRQDGSGDTPGPNNKELIGRPWLAAQTASGVPGTIIDIRPPEEYRAGHIPRATLAPNRQILTEQRALPAKDKRVTVYDADGSDVSFQVAAALREAGWSWARSLQGGWAEWLEHGEVTAAPAEDSRVGETVELPDGRRGVIQEGSSGALRVLLDFEAGEFVELPAADAGAS